MTAVVAADIRAALDEVGRSVADRAAALDAGRTDVRPDLAALGRAGLFEPGFGADLTDMVYVIDEISTHSLAVGFRRGRTGWFCTSCTTPSRVPTRTSAP